MFLLQLPMILDFIKKQLPIAMSQSVYPVLSCSNSKTSGFSFRFLSTVSRFSIDCVVEVLFHTPPSGDQMFPKNTD